MSLGVTITYVQKAGSQLRVGFKLAPSGNYPSGGDTVNFATATQDPNFVGQIAAVEALGAPLSFDVWSNGGQITDQYICLLGTTPANNKVKVITAFNTELGAGAYPAAVTGDTIVGEATFNNL